VVLEPPLLFFYAATPSKARESIFG